MVQRWDKLATKGASASACTNLRPQAQALAPTKGTSASACTNIWPQAQALAPTFGRKRKRLHQPLAASASACTNQGRKRKRLHQHLAASASACTNLWPQAQALAPTVCRKRKRLHQLVGANEELVFKLCRVGSDEGPDIPWRAETFQDARLRKHLHRRNIHRNH
jgi:hypothetical protein